MNGTKKAGRQATLALVAVLVAGPAAAVTGLSKHASETTDFDTASPKTADAYCPPGKLVVGGGAWVFEEGAGGQALLTQLQPFHGGRQDFYRASPHFSQGEGPAEWRAPESRAGSVTYREPACRS